MTQTNWQSHLPPDAPHPRKHETREDYLLRMLREGEDARVGELSMAIGARLLGMDERAALDRRALGLLQ